MPRKEAYPILKETEKKNPSVVVDYGEVSVQGRRWEMEDTHVIIPGFRGKPDEFFAGVYDGHNGRHAADLASVRLHENLAKLLEYLPPQKALKQAFLLTDKEIAETGMEDGSTVVVSYIKGTDLYVANAGDARAVLGRGLKVRRLSHDHKANDRKEVSRIEELGGFVTSAYETGIPRVNGRLAISRAIGDHNGNLEGFISAEPYITHTLLQPEDHTLILACDGIWDVIRDRKAIGLTQDILDPTEAALFLKDEAINNRRSEDNVTVIVVKLKVPEVII